MSERLQRGLKLRNKRETGGGPLKGKNQSERLQLSKTRGRSEGQVSVPAATGRQENRQAEAEA